MAFSTQQLVSPASLGRLAWAVVRSIGGTLSIEQRFADDRSRQLSPEPFIYVLWHGRMFMPMICFRNSGVNIIVSEHRDGEIVATTLESAGFKTVRGSSTRGGVRALAKLVRLARAGKRIAFTADGPVGPKWKLQPGAVYVAAKTGLPVVPITGSISRSYYFGSWDSLQFPMPFSRAVLLCGEPYTVTGGTGDDDIERNRLEIERRLTNLTLEADAIVGASDRP